MIVHYVRRFFTSLSPRPPLPAETAWAASVATPAEYALLARLSNQDRRHLIESARQVERALGPGADPVWVRAALLHDVGKYHAGLGVFGRSVATVVAVTVGRARVGTWAERSGWRGRVGRYERHGEIGADELLAAGSPEAVVEWSRVHHRRDQFAASTIPPPTLTLLDAADH